MEHFFVKLFARKEFLDKLLKHDFNLPSGWEEMILCILLIWLTHSVCKSILAHYNNQPPDQKHLNFWNHLAGRLLWPSILLVSTLIATFFWHNFTGNAVLWLQLLLMAALWMLLIRTFLALLRSIIPNNRFTIAMEYSLSSILWVGFIIWLTGADSYILQLLKSLSFPMGKATINLYTIIVGIVTVGIAIIIAMWISKLIDGGILSIKSLDLNLRYVLSKVIKTFLLILAVLIALPMVGIDLTMLSIFGSALGVGLGFGLQKIASNYLSGFIILADHSVRPGDRLNINGFTGYVTKITARFVVLRSLTGSEALIPNDTFIANTVINDSFSSPILSNYLTVQVSYGTDLPKALELFTQAATKQPRVCKDPAPNSYVTAFGDSGINLYLLYWISDPENGFMGLNSAILLDVWQSFTAAGIEFPSPQQDVRILNNSEDPIAFHATASNNNNPQPSDSLNQTEKNATKSPIQPS